MNDLVCTDDISNATIRRVSDFSKEGRKNASGPLDLSVLDTEERYTLYGAPLVRGKEFVNRNVSGSEIRAIIVGYSMKGESYLYYVKESERQEIVK